MSLILKKGGTNTQSQILFLLEGMNQTIGEAQLTTVLYQDIKHRDKTQSLALKILLNLEASQTMQNPHGANGYQKTRILKRLMRMISHPK